MTHAALPCATTTATTARIAPPITTAATANTIRYSLSPHRRRRRLTGTRTPSLPRRRCLSRSSGCAACRPPPSTIGHRHRRTVVRTTDRVTVPYDTITCHRTIRTPYPVRVRLQAPGPGQPGHRQARPGAAGSGLAAVAAWVAVVVREQAASCASCFFLLSPVVVRRRCWPVARRPPLPGQTSGCCPSSTTDRPRPPRSDRRHYHHRQALTCRFNVVNYFLVQQITCSSLHFTSSSSGHQTSRLPCPSGLRRRQLVAARAPPSLLRHRRPGWPPARAPIRPTIQVRRPDAVVARRPVQHHRQATDGNQAPGCQTRRPSDCCLPRPVARLTGTRPACVVSPALSRHRPSPSQGSTPSLLTGTSGLPVGTDARLANCALPFRRRLTTRPPVHHQHHHQSPGQACRRRQPAVKSDLSTTSSRQQRQPSALPSLHSGLPCASQLCQLIANFAALVGDRAGPSSPGQASPPAPGLRRAPGLLPRRRQPARPCRQGGLATSSARPGQPGSPAVNRQPGQAKQRSAQTRQTYQPCARRRHRVRSLSSPALTRRPSRRRRRSIKPYHSRLYRPLLTTSYQSSLARLPFPLISTGQGKFFLQADGSGQGPGCSSAICCTRRQPPGRQPPTPGPPGPRQQTGQASGPG